MSSANRRYDIAIMQPTYLPWAGYFNLISQVDNFLFLDDAQISKGSWHYRNRLCASGEMQWLTAPIEYQGHKSIHETRIRRHAGWPTKHIAQMRNAYVNAACVGELEPLFEEMHACQSETLAGMNIQLISFCMDKLDLQTQVHMTSVLKISGRRSERLLNLIRHFNGKSYLSPEGARGYLEEDNVLQAAGIDVAYQDYLPKPYPQSDSEDFLSHLSIVDVVANIGWKKTKRYVRSISA